jgi:hypothetical protein
LLKLFAVFVTIAMTFWFIKITNNRFDEDKLYAVKIPSSSPIQNPSIYSNLDYVSQWGENSFIVLDRYKFKTTMGQNSLIPLLQFLNHFTPLKWNAKKYNNLHKSLLGDDKYYTFNGLVAAWVFDFGYIVSILLALFYNRMVKKIRPVNGQMYIKHLLLLALLIQLPLFAIFYNSISGIIFPLLFFIPINIYLGSLRHPNKSALETSSGSKP